SVNRAKDPGKANSPEWHLRLQPLVFQSPQRGLVLEANLDWPRRGEWHVAVQNLNTSTLNDFLKEPLPPVRIEQLGVSGAWSNGPVKLALGLDAHFNPMVKSLNSSAPGAATQGRSGVLSGTHVQPTWPFALHLSVAGDDQGVDLRKLQVASQSVPVVTGHGRF